MVGAAYTRSDHLYKKSTWCAFWNRNFFPFLIIDGPPSVDVGEWRICSAMSEHTGSGLPMCFRHANIVGGISVVMLKSAA